MNYFIILKFLRPLGFDPHLFWGPRAIINKKKFSTFQDWTLLV